MKGRPFLEGSGRPLPFQGRSGDAARARAASSQAQPDSIYGRAGRIMAAKQLSSIVGNCAGEHEFGSAGFRWPWGLQRGHDDTLVMAGRVARRQPPSFGAHLYGWICKEDRQHATMAVETGRSGEAGLAGRLASPRGQRCALSLPCGEDEGAVLSARRAIKGRDLPFRRLDVAPEAFLHAPLKGQYPQLCSTVCHDAICSLLRRSSPPGGLAHLVFPAYGGQYITGRFGAAPCAGAPFPFLLRSIPVRRSFLAVTGLIFGVLTVLAAQAVAQPDLRAQSMPLDVAASLMAAGLRQDGFRGLQANVQRCYEELERAGAERGLKVAETCILLDRAANALVPPTGAPKEASFLSGEAYRARRAASAKVFFGGSVAAEDAYFDPRVRELLTRLRSASRPQAQ